MSADQPPWGTPDDGPTPGPAGSGYGSPGPAPDYGTPADQTASRGGTADGYGSPTPSPGRPVAGSGDPLTADAVIVIEQAGFLSSGGYDLATPDGGSLGSVLKESSAAGWLFGGAASSMFRMLDASGREVGSMLRPGSLGKSRFVVTDDRGNDVGTIEQENAFLAPRFLLTTVEGLTMRLTGGQFGSRDWQLVDGIDESVLMGQVSQEFAGLGSLLSGTDRFAVQLSPQLLGGNRLLALMGTICLDYVRDSKKKRNRAGPSMF